MASARERNHHHSKDILLTPTPLKAKEKSTKKTSFLDFFPDFLGFFADFLEFVPDF